MAKSKWETVKDKLILVEGWARDGLTDEQIANNLRISERTFYDYKKKYPQFSQSLKRGKEVVDYEVENALLQNALNGNITAQIFWLKNRKPTKWKDKVEDKGDNDKDLNNVKEILVKIKEVANDDKDN